MTELVEKAIRELREYAQKNLPLPTMKDDEVKDALTKFVTERGKAEYWSMTEQVAVRNGAYSAIRGLGILDELLDDDDITEIMVNGPFNIFIERKGKLVRYEKSFESENQLLNIAHRIADMAGREVSQADPICDTRLMNGSRVNIVLPPVALCGPTITIRKFSKTPMTMEQLLKFGSLTPDIAEILQKLVEARYNIFVCGGTGSGKTTFLNALSNYIPRSERIITIEDSAELQIANIDNLVSLETRNANSTGQGLITIRDLIKSSLRMRPDRIIVGEVRGEEALDMLQAMNTGHDGSLSTGHANSTKDMLSRLETMVLQGASGLPLDAVRRQIGSALDVIVFLSRLRDHSRKTMEIAEVIGYEGGEYTLNTLYAFEEDENSTKSKVSGKLVKKNDLQNVHKLQLAGLTL